MLTVYDAVRCPFCARARIALDEKGVPYRKVAIDLSNRPAWLYEKNPLGRVPVLEDGNFVLPESSVIMEYLEERFPSPALLPASPEERAHARLLVYRFDLLGDDYYKAFFRQEQEGLERFGERLAELEARLERQPYLIGSSFGLADIAYVPWILRARDRFGYSLDELPALSSWLERLAQRPSVAAEIEAVAALAA